MSAEQTRNIVRKMVEAFNTRQFDTLSGAIFSPGLIYTQNGRAGDLNKWIQDSRGCVVAFPDAHLAVKSQEVVGDHVVTRLVFTGTHLGPLGEIPPTGRSVNAGITLTSRAENGLIVDHSEQTDDMAMMQQLGLGAPEES